jgi:hypothetical protein
MDVTPMVEQRGKTAVPRAAERGLSPRVSPDRAAFQSFADAAPGRGALPLLGAPLLAVVVTFVLQPKASGSYHDAPLASEPVFAIPAEPALGLSATDTSFQGESKAISSALDAGQFERARTLLAKPAPAGAREHWRAYRLMLECLEQPSNGATAGAYRFYLEDAPADLRPDLFRACLSAR